MEFDMPKVDRGGSKPREVTRGEKQEQAKWLKERIDKVAREINGELLASQGIRDFLKLDASINMDSYITRRALESSDDSAYWKALDDDKKAIREKDVEWSGAENANVQANYREKYPDQIGVNIIEDIIRLKKEARTMSKNGQMEMVVTALFHKIFKKQFIIVRASTYDDYFNKVDTLLVNKETGDVVCAFDEVHDHQAGNRREDKEAKIKTIAKEGGTWVKYGFRMKGKKVIEEPIRNLPVFFLSLTTNELEDLLSDMSLGAEAAPSEVEVRIMKKFIADLEEQRETLNQLAVSTPVKTNLNKFGILLDQMRDLIPGATIISEKSLSGK